MKTIYTLQEAVTLSATGKKCDVVASPIGITELRKHQHYFSFDFVTLKKEGVEVYKIIKKEEPDVFQGLVAFKPSVGILNCFNMEVSILNKKPILLHTGLGKSMIALCCKISFDLGLDGFITFEAKNKLIPYYQRFGAIRIFGLRMAIDSPAAQKLVDIYF